MKDREMESNDLKKIYKRISLTADIMYNNGWAEAYAGNISFRTGRYEKKPSRPYIKLDRVYASLASQEIIITSSGSRMREIAAHKHDDLISVIYLDNEGKGYYLKGSAPSSEIPVHLGLQNMFINTGSKFRAVIHCHPDNMISVLHNKNINSEKVLYNELSKMHSEIALLIPEGIGVTKDLCPGSRELSIAVLNSMKNKNITLIPRHGCFASGIDLSDALDRIEAVEKACSILIKSNYSINH